VAAKGTVPPLTPAGAGVLARPLNLLVALVTLSFILSVVGGIVVDQYPCWVGVPNCD
jgi:hypothetical protein